MVLKTLFYSPFNHLTRLLAREYFIEFSRREGFKSYEYITHIYGEEALHDIRRLESLRKKKSRLLSSLALLLRCRDQNIIPTCMKVKHHVDTEAARRIL
jgi:hypothetical protein